MEQTNNNDVKQLGGGGKLPVYGDHHALFNRIMTGTTTTATGTTVQQLQQHQQHPADRLLNEVQQLFIELKADDSSRYHQNAVDQTTCEEYVKRCMEQAEMYKKFALELSTLPPNATTSAAGIHSAASRTSDELLSDSIATLCDTMDSAVYVAVESMWERTNKSFPGMFAGQDMNAFRADMLCDGTRLIRMHQRVDDEIRQHLRQMLLDTVSRLSQRVLEKVLESLKSCQTMMNDKKQQRSSTPSDNNRQQKMPLCRHQTNSNSSGGSSSSSSGVGSAEKQQQQQQHTDAAALAEPATTTDEDEEEDDDDAERVKATQKNLTKYYSENNDQLLMLDKKNLSMTMTMKNAIVASTSLAGSSTGSSSSSDDRRRSGTMPASRVHSSSIYSGSGVVGGSIDSSSSPCSASSPTSTSPAASAEHKAAAAHGVNSINRQRLMLQQQLHHTPIGISISMPPIAAAQPTPLSSLMPTISAYGKNFGLQLLQNNNAKWDMSGSSSYDDDVAAGTASAAAVAVDKNDHHHKSMQHTPQHSSVCVKKSDSILHKMRADLNQHQQMPNSPASAAYDMFNSDLLQSATRLAFERGMSEQPHAQQLHHLSAASSGGDVNAHHKPLALHYSYPADADASSSSTATLLDLADDEQQNKRERADSNNSSGASKSSSAAAAAMMSYAAVVAGNSAANSSVIDNNTTNYSSNNLFTSPSAASAAYSNNASAHDLSRYAAIMPLQQRSPPVFGVSSSHTHHNFDSLKIKNKLTMLLEERVPDNVSSFTNDPGMAVVPLWLKSLRLHKYQNLFARLSYEQMMTLDEDTLSATGMTLGARKKIIGCIQKLHERSLHLERLEYELIQKHENPRTILYELCQLINTPMMPFSVVMNRRMQISSATTNANNSNRVGSRMIFALHSPSASAANATSAGAANSSSSSIASASSTAVDSNIDWYALMGDRVANVSVRDADAANLSGRIGIMLFKVFDAIVAQRLNDKKFDTTLPPAMASSSAISANNNVGTSGSNAAAAAAAACLTPAEQAAAQLEAQLYAASPFHWLLRQLWQTVDRIVLIPAFASDPSLMAALLLLRRRCQIMSPPQPPPSASTQVPSQQQQQALSSTTNPMLFNGLRGGTSTSSSVAVGGGHLKLYRSHTIQPTMIHTSNNNSNTINIGAATFGGPMRASPPSGSAVAAASSGMSNSTNSTLFAAACPEHGVLSWRNSTPNTMPLPPPSLQAPAPSLPPASTNHSQSYYYAGVGVDADEASMQHTPLRKHRSLFTSGGGASSDYYQQLQQQQQMAHQPLARRQTTGGEDDVMFSISPPRTSTANANLQWRSSTATNESSSVVPVPTQPQPQPPAVGRTSLPLKPSASVGAFRSPTRVQFAACVSDTPTKQKSSDAAATQNELSVDDSETAAAGNAAVVSSDAGSNSSRTTMRQHASLTRSTAGSLTRRISGGGSSGGGDARVPSLSSNSSNNAEQMNNTKYSTEFAAIPEHYNNNNTNSNTQQQLQQNNSMSVVPQMFNSSNNNNNSSSCSSSCEQLGENSNEDCSHRQQQQQPARWRQQLMEDHQRQQQQQQPQHLSLGRTHSEPFTSTSQHQQHLLMQHQQQQQQQQRVNHHYDQLNAERHAIAKRTFSNFHDAAAAAATAATAAATEQRLRSVPFFATYFDADERSSSREQRGELGNNHRSASGSSGGTSSGGVIGDSRKCQEPSSSRGPTTPTQTSMMSDIEHTTQALCMNIAENVMQESSTNNN